MQFPKKTLRITIPNVTNLVPFGIFIPKNANVHLNYKILSFWGFYTFELIFVV